MTEIEAEHLTKSEIKTRLKTLWEKDKYYPSVIVARAALRLFPLLARGESFRKLRFENEKASKAIKAEELIQPLFAVFLSNTIVLELSSSEKGNKSLAVELLRYRRSMSELIESYRSQSHFENDYAYEAIVGAMSAVDVADYVEYHTSFPENAVNYLHIIDRVSSVFFESEPFVNAIQNDLSIALRAENKISVIHLPLWKNLPIGFTEVLYEEFFPILDLLMKGANRDQENAVGNIQILYTNMLYELSEKKILETIKGDSRQSPENERVAIDTLNRQGLVDGLAELLCNKENQGHMTIGLLGHWGSGKTRVLDLLRNELKKRNKKGDKCDSPFLLGEFNAWAYEHSENIQAGMAHEVIKSLTSLQNLSSYEKQDDWKPNFDRIKSRRLRAKLEKFTYFLTEFV